MGNGRCFCEQNPKRKNSITLKMQKNIQSQYTMIDLLVGLNPNNQLYELNALLQCLCHIEPLVNYFKYKFKEIKKINSYKKSKNNGLCLAECFKKIIDDLWPDIDIKNKSEIITNHNTKSSKEFLDMIYKINPNYNENQEYLIKFLQNRLHEELNMVENKYNNYINNVNNDLRDKKNLLIII